MSFSWKGNCCLSSWRCQQRPWTNYRQKKKAKEDCPRKITTTKHTNKTCFFKAPCLVKNYGLRKFAFGSPFLPFVGLSEPLLHSCNLESYASNFIARHENY